MRKFIFTALMIMVMGVAYADCTANIVATGIDDNGNIVVSTQHICDGVEVQSRYPQVNGKYIWQTRYSFQNFDGMTEQQRNDYILNDVSKFDESLIAKNYAARTNSQMSFASLIGQSRSVSTTDIQLSPTKALTVNTAGVAVEKVLTPVAPDNTLSNINANTNEIKAKVDAISEAVAQ